MKLKDLYWATWVLNVLCHFQAIENNLFNLCGDGKCKNALIPQTPHLQTHYNIIQEVQVHFNNSTTGVDIPTHFHWSKAEQDYIDIVHMIGARLKV